MDAIAVQTNTPVRTITGTRGATATREQLPDLAERASIALESLRTQWRTVAHLGTHERMAISQLRVYGPMQMSELAARIALSRAAVTSLIDRLEADGWLRRQSDERDRRRTLLVLEPQSYASCDDVTRTFRTELAAWSSEMSEAEWRVVASFLDRVTAIAERQADDLRTTALERSLA